MNEHQYPQKSLILQEALSTFHIALLQEALKTGYVNGKGNILILLIIHSYLKLILSSHNIPEAQKQMYKSLIYFLGVLICGAAVGSEIQRSMQIHAPQPIVEIKYCWYCLSASGSQTEDS